MKREEKIKDGSTESVFTIAITCPSCGGGITFVEGSTKVKCKHCGLSHIVVGGAGLKQYYIPKRVRRAEALRSMREFVKSKTADDGGTREVRLIDAKLVYVPVYRVKAKGGGLYIGQERAADVEVETVSETGEVVVIRKPRKLLNGNTFKEITYFVPALDVSELGTFGISTKSSVMELHVFDEDQMSMKWMVFDAVEEPEAAQNKTWAVLASSLKPRNIDLKYFEVEKISEEVSKIYYPLYLVRFLLDGEAIRAVVDGLGGNVIRARIPKRAKEFNPVPGVLLLSLFAFILSLFKGIFILIPISFAAIIPLLVGTDRFLMAVKRLFIAPTQGEEYTVG